MEEAVTKVIDTLTQEDFHGAFQKLLEQYNKRIAAWGDYFERNLSFMCVLSIKVPIRKKSLETYLMILVKDEKKDYFRKKSIRLSYFIRRIFFCVLRLIFKDSKLLATLFISS